MLLFSLLTVGSQLPLLRDRPSQPRNLSFPYKSYGHRNRSFQSGWFDRHPWLHYVESLDAVFCHTCIKAVASNLISSENADSVFTRYRYSNWKSATEKNKGFRKHEASASLKEAVARYISTPAEVIGDVGELLCNQHAEEKMKSRKISENIQNATFFTIMADETADISNEEQLVVCIRWVDENFAVHEDFIAMYPLERTTADHIVAVLKNCLISMDLRIENARG